MFASGASTTARGYSRTTLQIDEAAKLATHAITHCQCFRGSPVGNATSRDLAVKIFKPQLLSTRTLFSYPDPQQSTYGIHPCTTTLIGKNPLKIEMEIYGRLQRELPNFSRLTNFLDFSETADSSFLIMKLPKTPLYPKDTSPHKITQTLKGCVAIGTIVGEVLQFLHKQRILLDGLSLNDLWLNSEEKLRIGNFASRLIYFDDPSIVLNYYQDSVRKPGWFYRAMNSADENIWQYKSLLRDIFENIQGSQVTTQAEHILDTILQVETDLTTIIELLKKEQLK